MDGEGGMARPLRIDLVAAWYHVMSRGHRGGLLLLPEKEHDKRWRSGVQRAAQALPGPDPGTLHCNVAAHIVDVIDATLLPSLTFLEVDQGWASPHLHEMALN